MTDPRQLPGTNQAPPETIIELWYRLENRLNLIEQAQGLHGLDHGEITKVLDDHENRIRSNTAWSGITGLAASLLAMSAAIKSFFFTK